MPSTVISNISYDPSRKALLVKFVSGLLYEYADVPGQVYRAFRSATSKGQYLNQHIKGHFRHRKIEQDN